MSSSVPNFGTGSTPLIQYGRGYGEGLFTKFRREAKAVAQETESRWHNAIVDINFRGGSYDGMHRGTTSFMLGKSQFASNMIDPKCLWITGYQRNNRKEYRMEPLSEKFGGVAEQYNKIFKKINATSKLLPAFSDAFDRAVTASLSLVEIYPNPCSFRPCDLKARVWTSIDFIIDPNFREPDLSDASFLATNQFVGREEARVLFPGVPEAYITAVPSPANPFSFLRERNASGFPSRELVQVIRYWRRVAVDRTYIVRLEDGAVKRVVGDDAIEALSAFPNEFVVKKVKTLGWALAVFVNGFLAHDYADNPYGLEKLPIVPVFWRHVPEASSAELKFQSLPRSMRDMVYIANRRLCMQQDAIEGRPNSGFLIPKGAVDDINEYKSGSNVLVSVYNPERGIPQAIVPYETPPSELQFLEMVRSMANQSTPITDTIMGISEGANRDAGVKNMLQQSAGQTSVQPILDCLDRSLCLIGEVVRDFISTCMPPEEVERITGAPPVPGFYLVNENDAMMVCSLGLYTDTQRKALFNEWMEFSTLTGINLPPEAWAQVAPMQGKDVILKIIDDQQKQAAAMAKEKHDYELGMARAQIAEVLSKSYENVALAKERNARAASNIGLQDERESEVNRNKGALLTSVVDSLVKLMEAKAKHGAINEESAINDLSNISKKIDEQTSKQALKADIKTDKEGLRDNKPPQAQELFQQETEQPQEPLLSEGDVNGEVR